MTDPFQIISQREQADSKNYMGDAIFAGIIKKFIGDIFAFSLTTFAPKVLANAIFPAKRHSFWRDMSRFFVRSLHVNRRPVIGGKAACDSCTNSQDLFCTSSEAMHTMIFSGITAFSKPSLSRYS